jgi:hypothetical protein
MRKKNYKGRCEKQSLEKFTTICKTYDPIQTAYANILVKNKDVVEVRCNVALAGDKYGEYMTDFVCVKMDGELMVRECMSRKMLSRPQMAAMLELSRTYWLQHGVDDWGVVVDAAE